MLDLGFVRANLELVEEKLRHRGQDPAELLGDFKSLDARRREAITDAEQLKAQRNKLTEEVAKKKKAGEDASALMDQVRGMKERIDADQQSADAIDKDLQAILQRIPNLPQATVPVGRSEADNVVVKTWGEKPTFDFTPKPHWELGEALGILDQARAAKLSGARFAVYWAQGARLERALASYMLDLHTTHHGYTEVLPPYMVNSASMYGTGQLPKFAEDLFKSRTATTGSFRLRKSRLPISFAMNAG